MRDIECLSSFKNEIVATLGVDPGPIIGDGRVHRFGPKKVGWYICYPDGPVPAGAYGDWRQGTTHKWASKNDGTMSADQRAAFREKMQRAEQARQEAQEKEKEKAGERAKAIWERAKEADTQFPYLIKKGIRPCGIRQSKKALVIPIKTLDGQIKSLQFITEDGGKRFLKGGEINGNFSWVKSTGGERTLYVCEGFATGCSLHEATGNTVIIAFSAGNLEPVVEKIRKKYPNRPVIVCSDNDLWTTKQDGSPWNPGKEKALKAAWKFGCKIALPSFSNTENKPTDFNDLHQLEGLEEVQKQVGAAVFAHEFLLNEVQGDPGAPYRPEHLAGLRRLKAENRALFEAVRGKLKKLKIGVTRLDEAINKKAEKQDETGFDHLTIAKRIIKEIGIENILYHQNFIWKWQNRGVWRKIDDREIKRMIQKGASDVTKSLIESVLDLFKTEIFRPEHQFNVDTSTINCLNGELHWTGTKWELRDHNREHYRTTQIPVHYNPKATAPQFEAFFDEVFRDDPDREDKAVLLCEALGYSLLSSTEYEKFFLLIGPGANGKSVLMDVLSALVGHENVAGVQPDQFANKFQRAHLHGKLVNLVTEIPEGYQIADAELKSIVSGELTTAEHKNKNPFDFRPFSTCWFGSNHMPSTRDFSDALFRRAVVIPFNRTFAEKEQDRQLKTKLKAELPGILNFALAAIAGVFKRGVFTEPDSTKKAKKEWRLNCDQVAQFAQDECDFGPGLQTPSSEIYQAYREWATESGIKRPVNRNNFTARICRLGAGRFKGAKGVRFLAGVGLKYQG